MGTVDDPSYARSAQLLAQTGHIVYNGWAAPILGWHLYWGALFIKLFGFSFNVLRISTLVVAMFAAFLSHRTMVRCGVSERNATLATLTLVLSPLFLPLTFSYMTDIGGYLVPLLCLYACLRALQAGTDTRACWWIAFAAISDALGGTIRQTAWLGLLLIVPAMLWLLRGRRKALLWGIVSIAIGAAIVAGATEWFRHQPHTVSVPVWSGGLTKDRLRNTLRTMARTLFDAPVFLLPVLLLFPARLRDRKALIGFVIGCAAICGLLMLIQPQWHAWLEPSMGNYFSPYGVLNGSGINGLRPVILTERIQLLLTAAVIAGISAMAVVMVRSRKSRLAESALPWSALFLMTVPFAAVYIALMLSRAGVNMVFDRYLLPLLFVLLLFITRYYQEHLQQKVPSYGFVLLAIVAIYSIGATHDAFAMLRARYDAIRELQARGVPDTEIDGGWEFNSWAGLKRTGYVPYPGDQAVRNLDVACEPPFAASMPGLNPKYTLSYDPNLCGGQVGVPPVHYREWFGPRDVSVYVVASRR